MVKAPLLDDVVVSDWTATLPVVSRGRVTVRELRARDASSLCAMVHTEDLAWFMSPPPTTIEAFERFIAWSQRERRRGRCACFAIVPNGMDTAAGLIQVRAIEPGFATAEWRFALGSDFWGSGCFEQAAHIVMDFAFTTLGVHRLEARSAIANGRGNGALRKLGATQEGLLRRSFLKNGEYLDQHLWSILDVDWLGRLHS